MEKLNQKEEMKLEFKKEELIKSPLNYTGGKFKLLPQILPLFPNKIDKFVDLFTGGCNVGINVKANKIICNDYMHPIIDMYTEMQKLSIEDVYIHINNRIHEFKLSKENKEGYVKFRKFYNENRNPLDLYVCICHSFSNSIRFNSKLEFNASFGERDFNIALQERLSKFLLKIKPVIFSRKNFIDLKIDKLSIDDFIYIDPPYLITTANYNDGKRGFDGWNDDHEYKLLNLLDSLSSKDIRFALSNVLEHKGKSNDILKEWAKNYNVHYLNYNYGNCNYQTKDKSKDSSIEVLITNY